MAESDHAKKIILQKPEQSDVLTGGNSWQKFLYHQLVDSISRAQQIDIIVSFLMESGVRLLLKEFAAALDRGVKIRILTGNYLGITQPSALYLLKHELPSAIDLRFYNEKDRAFHPKAYIFHYENDSDIFIGSSNISRSALTSGIEWNYRFNSKNSPDNYNEFINTFNDLFENHSIVIDDEELKRYSKSWHRPTVEHELEEYDKTAPDLSSKIEELFKPRGAQIEAICALQNCRAEGAKKALVMAATGIGKTYLAAFDSADYKRILFIAHREEILQQAAATFRAVRRTEDFGFFNGDEKCIDKSIIFASVATLGKEEFLNTKYFSKDQFDYLVIDEFHHAVGKQYQKIIKYFEPKFLLGLTATPERLDGKNIYELCDYNVAYEIDLKEAINKGLLVPFHYYGIYDDTNYEGLHLVNGKYEENELCSRYLSNPRRFELIFKHFRKYDSKRALAFCCSKEHAEAMAKDFCTRGIPAVAVYSNGKEDRSAAIFKLKSQKIRIIFAVDMFNEGVDIPSIDLVMFLRPTESPVIFLQQLGRGLRRAENKKYLTVLDFIGNYEKAGLVRYLLSGTPKNELTASNGTLKQEDYPDNCQIDFDIKLIDLFAEMEKKTLSVKKLILSEYYRIKNQLGKRPSRVELFTYMDDSIYRLALSHTKEAPFKKYLSFLYEINDLSEQELLIYNSIGHEFLEYLETTNMTKIYKMPVLSAFLSENSIKMSVSLNEVLKSWKEFFIKNGNWKDLDNITTYQQYLHISDKWHLKKIKQMPIHFLLESGKSFFREGIGDIAIQLCPEMSKIVLNPFFASHFEDIINYRTLDYYQRRYHAQK